MVLDDRRDNEVLWVPDRAMNRATERLGMCGEGVLLLEDVIRPGFQESLIQELTAEGVVPWWDASDEYYNVSGVKIIQNHDVFALKLSAGDQSKAKQMTRMTSLGLAIQGLIRSMDGHFPSLGSWTADEMSYHRYYDRDLGLSYHRDNLRFVGLVAVASVLGECDFMTINRTPRSRVYNEELGKEVVDEWDVVSEKAHRVRPRDIMLMRGMGLYDGMQAEDRPEHAVMNGRVVPRISFMLRDNNKPADTGYGFTYYNWP